MHAMMPVLLSIISTFQNYKVLMGINNFYKYTLLLQGVAIITGIAPYSAWREIADKAASSSNIVRLIGPDFFLTLLSTSAVVDIYVNRQILSRHVDIIFNISTKEQWKNKMSIIMWEAAMRYVTTFK